LAREGFDLWQAGRLEESVAKYIRKKGANVRERLAHILNSEAG
jgi:hypothetical protein